MARVTSGERRDIARLHNLQHDRSASNLVTPVGGGSVIAWAAHELAATRAALAALDATPELERIIHASMDREFEDRGPLPAAPLSGSVVK